MLQESIHREGGSAANILAEQQPDAVQYQLKMQGPMGKPAIAGNPLRLLAVGMSWDLAIQDTTVTVA